MKIRHVLIENFKSIKRFEHSFVNELTGEVRPVTAIFGDNGCGKTSVLQAVALVISLATEKTSSPQKFKWHGFLADRMGTLGQTYIRIELEWNDYDFVENHQAFHALSDEEKAQFLVPPENEWTVLEFKSGKLESTASTANSLRALKRFLATEPSLNDIITPAVLADFGDVYWYDQYRNLVSGSFGDQEPEVYLSGDWQAGVASLRESLIGWWYYHQQHQSEEDVIKRLERAYANVFPGTRFIGTQLMNPAITRPKTTDWYFLIQRDNTIYDISEMSSGEQVVFSMLYDFVSNSISRSIILIDELELHLHPPEQQSLYNSLRKIGPDCQFIITSHSTYLKDIMSPNARIRLEGGRACL